MKEAELPVRAGLVESVPPPVAARRSQLASILIAICRQQSRLRGGSASYHTAVHTMQHAACLSRKLSLLTVN